MQPGIRVVVPLDASNALDREKIGSPGKGIMLMRTQPFPSFRVWVSFDQDVDNKIPLFPGQPYFNEFNECYITTSQGAGIAGKTLEFFVAQNYGFFPAIGTNQEAPMVMRPASYNDCAHSRQTLDNGTQFYVRTGGYAYQWAKELYIIVEGPGSLWVSLQHNVFANSSKPNLLLLQPDNKPYILPLVTPGDLESGTTYYRWSASWNDEDVTFCYGEFNITGR